MISISNPADIICEYIRRQMGWERNRCFCTGTSLETYRLLRVLSHRTGYARRSIQGMCMGEHGNSSFIVWSQVYVGGKPSRLHGGKAGAGGAQPGRLADGSQAGRRH